MTTSFSPNQALLEEVASPALNTSVVDILEPPNILKQPLFNGGTIPKYTKVRRQGLSIREIVYQDTMVQGPCPDKLLCITIAFSVNINKIILDFRRPKVTIIHQLTNHNHVILTIIAIIRNI